MVNLRYGFIQQVDYAQGVAKVYIEELDIMTDWATLPKRINENWIFKIDTQVAVIYDDRENFEILCPVPYENENGKDLPPEWANEHTEGVEFSDGTKIIYDSTNKLMTIDAPTADIKMNCKSLTISGDLNTNGGIKAQGDVVAGTVSLKNHIHTTSQGNTSAPVI